MTARNMAAIVGLLGLGAIGCDGASSVAAKDEPVPLAAAAPASVTPACGAKNQPDCPLQNWMKATVQTYQRENNYERLARALDDLAAHAPAGYEKWADVSEQAAAAARRSDAAGVRLACKTCHDEHRAKYRRELRAAKWM